MTVVKRRMRNAAQKKVVQSKDVSLVGAGSLDVTGLLALVADTVVRDLGRAVTGQVADLTACVELAYHSQVEDLRKRHVQL